MVAKKVSYNFFAKHCQKIAVENERYRNACHKSTVWKRCSNTGRILLSKNVSIEMLKKVPEKTCRKHGRKKSVVEGEHRNAQILPYTNAAQSTIKKIRFKKLPFKNAHQKKQ